MSRISDVKKGDLLVWSPDPLTNVKITVNRVAKDGTWADIHCWAGTKFWTKRQRMPMPEGCKRVAS